MPRHPLKRLKDRTCSTPTGTGESPSGAKNHRQWPDLAVAGGMDLGAQSAHGAAECVVGGFSKQFLVIREFPCGAGKVRPVSVGPVDGRVHRNRPVDQAGGQKPPADPVSTSRRARNGSAAASKQSATVQTPGNVPPGNAASVPANDPFNDLAVTRNGCPCRPSELGQQPLDH
jgi:hypothetical protein